MPAVFIDRDGVINRNRPEHVKAWSEFEFLPGALEGLARLTRAGCEVFVITNQAVVNRGLVSHEAIEEINRRMVEQVERNGGSIGAVLVCPHKPEEGCGCRKPMPGLLLEAERRYGVRLGEAYLIGDFPSDIEAGRAVGSTPIFVLTGRGNDAFQEMPAEVKQQCLVAETLLHAVEIIEERERAVSAVSSRDGKDASRS